MVYTDILRRRTAPEKIRPSTNPLILIMGISPLRSNLFCSIHGTKKSSKLCPNWLTGSQPPGWEPVLRGSASSFLTRGSSPFGIHSQPGGWELG